MSAKHIRSVYTVRTWEGRSQEVRGSEEGGEGGKVYRAGVWAVGQATSVSGAHIVCVQCTYVEDSLPGSIGQRGRQRGGEGLQSWGAGCRSGDKRQRSANSMCTVYVHGRVAPRECRAARNAAKGGRSTELGRGL